MKMSNSLTKIAFAWSLAIFVIAWASPTHSRTSNRQLIAQTLPTAPTFTQPNKAFTSSTFLDMHAQSGNQIFYTIDGSQPTTSSILYSDRIYPAVTTQYNAIAVDSSGNQSPVSSVYICIDPLLSNFPSNHLAIWLKSDFGVVSSSSNVSKWVDLSGLSNDFTQTNTENQPTAVESQINGYTAVNFTPGSSGQFLQFPSGYFNDLSNGFTFFLVVKPTNLASGATIMDMGNGSASDNVNITESSTSGGVQASIYNGATASSVNASTGLTANNFQLIEVTFDGAHTCTLYNNGVQIAQNSAMQTPNNVTRAINFLGQASGGGNFFHGQCTEVMLYNFNITSTQRFQIESYMMSKYQLLTQTPVAPILSSSSTTFLQPSQVAISTDGNSEIFWTNDGSTPTSSSNQYTGPLNIMYTQTINAIAVSTLTGHSSPVSSATYTLDASKWPPPSTGGPTLQINITAPSPAIPQ